MVTIGLFIITFIMLFFTPTNERAKMILMFIYIALLVVWAVFAFGVDSPKWVR